jgi:hypothetical protein
MLQCHIKLTLALDGGGWSPSKPQQFDPVERSPSIQRTRGWMGLGAILETLSEREVSCSCQKLAIQLRG